MKLIELEPHLLKIESLTSYHRIDDVTQAQGIMFLCPKCYATNNGPVGMHSVLCWFANKGVPGELTPGPGRWSASGTDYTNLTLSPSVHLTGPGCGWHGFITNGEVSTV
jgi:hypothetical protein